MTISDSVHEFLEAGGVPSAKFAKFGDAITGNVVTAEKQQDRDYQTGLPKTWDDGQPKYVLVVTVATDVRDPKIDNDDGTRRIWARGAMLGAIRSALRTSRARLEPGGKLTVTYTHDNEPADRKMSPAKQYTAEYHGPPAGFSAEELPDDNLDDSF
jgi:hypothetical protein